MNMMSHKRSWRTDGRTDGQRIPLFIVGLFRVWPTLSARMDLSIHEGFPTNIDNVLVSQWSVGN